MKHSVDILPGSHLRHIAIHASKPGAILNVFGSRTQLNASPQVQVIVIDDAAPLTAREGASAISLEGGDGLCVTSEADVGPGRQRSTQFAGMRRIELADARREVN